MDFFKYKKLLKRADKLGKVRRNLAKAKDAIYSDDLQSATKAFKSAKNFYRRNSDEDLEKNPFPAKYDSVCAGCGQFINRGDSAEMFNKFGDVEDPLKAKWVIHDDKECYDVATRITPPVCPHGHGTMALKRNRDPEKSHWAAYWQCSAKEGTVWCNAKPPHGQGSWAHPGQPKGSKAKAGSSSTPRVVRQSTFGGKCKACKDPMEIGTNIVPWKNNDANIWVHENCFSADIQAKSENKCLVCKEAISVGDNIIVWRDWDNIWVHERCKDGVITIDIPNKFKPPKFTASPHQVAIKEAYLKTKTHLIIDAKAGSGKTTTLEWLINTTYTHPPKRILMMAFNKSISKELNNRMRTIPGVEASTLNSFGHRLVLSAYGKPKQVTSSKIKLLAQRPGVGPDGLGFPFKKEDQARLGLEGDELKRVVARNRQMVNLFQKMIDKVKANLASPSDYEEIIRAYKLPIEELSPEDHSIFLSTIPQLLEADIKSAVDREYLDFYDQIWLPVVGLVKTDVPILTPQAARLLRPVKFPKDIDVLFVDEAQDLNRCQQEMALRTIGEKGRLIAVGDPFQSIYAFSGADSISMSRLHQLLATTSRGCEVKDLSVTFRCPQAVVRHAQQILQTVIPAGMPVISPEQATIEAAPNAPEGVVQAIPEDIVFESLTIEKDAFLRGEHVPTMILCRTNAPLFGGALRLIRNGTPAKIIGRDVSKALLDYVDEINPKNNRELERFNQALQARLQHVEVLERELIEKGELDEGDEMSSPFQQEKDQASAISIISLSPSQSGENKTVDTLKKQLDDLFNGGMCPNQNLHEKDKNYIADAAETFCSVCLDERNEEVSIVKREGVIFSTVHKSKGLEALKIYILDPDRLGKPRASSSEEDQRQEIHLHYVAVTRTKFLKGDLDSGILTYLDATTPMMEADRAEYPVSTAPPAPVEEQEEEEQELPPEIVHAPRMPEPVVPASSPADNTILSTYKLWMDAGMTIPWLYPEGHKKVGKQVSFPMDEKGREKVVALLEANDDDVQAGGERIYCDPNPASARQARITLPAKTVETIVSAKEETTSPASMTPTIKMVEEIQKLTLPKMAASGLRGFVEPKVSDFLAIRASYLLRGIPAKIVILPGWGQLALIVNGIACSNTTINSTRGTRKLGEKALRVMQPDKTGRFMLRQGPTIKRTAGWQGRIVDRINEIILSRSPTEFERKNFGEMTETLNQNY